MDCEVGTELALKAKIAIDEVAAWSEYEKCHLSLGF